MNDNQQAVQQHIWYQDFTVLKLYKICFINNVRLLKQIRDRQKSKFTDVPWTIVGLEPGNKILRKHRRMAKFDKNTLEVRRTCFCTRRVKSIKHKNLDSPMSFSLKDNVHIKAYNRSDVWLWVRLLFENLANHQSITSYVCRRCAGPTRSPRQCFFDLQVRGVRHSQI